MQHWYKYQYSKDLGVQICIVMDTAQLVELTQAEDLSPVVVGHNEYRVRQQLEHLTRPQVREHQAHRQLVLDQPY